MLTAFAEEKKDVEAYMVFEIVKDLEFDVQYREVKTSPDNQEENIVCPECSFKQLVKLDSGQQRVECLKCGIMFTNFDASHLPMSNVKNLKIFKKRVLGE